MKIQNNYNYYNTFSPQTPKTPAFNGRNPVETIKHYNLGMVPDGIIGKIRAATASGDEVYLNVMKNTGSGGNENYQIKDGIGRLIGEIDIKIKKFYDFDTRNNVADPSHVFIELVRNYSDPTSKYYKQGLKEYKQIGTRLAQIAQRRSDEALCSGNLKLHAKDGAANFWKHLGFEPEPAYMCGYEGNKTRMYLPAHAKEPLSKLYGGL